MSSRVEALWLRAVRAAQGRKLLPPARASLTPSELAAEAARRGEDRLQRLVEGWYYPVSFGHANGALSDNEAMELVAAIEAEAPPPERPAAPPKPPRPPRVPRCQLCGAPA
ncbi:MAG: hypothetical protein JO359_05305 [Candidatus Eremiobacteraeota bacterium]|nr:hypothetical protein [Candidatus Eremiobacteraeota bacterium]